MSADPNVDILPEGAYQSILHSVTEPSDQPWYWRWFGFIPRVYYVASEDTIYAHEDYLTDERLRREYMRALGADSFISRLFSGENMQYRIWKHRRFPSATEDFS